MKPVAVSPATLDWLLAEENPPVRYLTLTRLLDLPPGSPAVRRAQARLGDYPPTRAILARRARFWRRGVDLYEKYRGGYWQLVFLGEYLAPPHLPGVGEGVEFILSVLERIPAGRPLYGFHCLNANLLRAMVALGHGGDPRVRAGLELVAGEVVAGGGVPCGIADWSVYPTCSMSLPKVLLALTAPPPAARGPMLRKAARICVERLLENRVHHYVSWLAREWNEGGRAASGLPEPTTWTVIRDPEKRRLAIAAKQGFVARRGGLGARSAKDGWDAFGFPQSYDSDVLEAMRALAQAGAPRRAPALAGALDLILSKRRADGRWSLESSLNPRMRAAVERRGRPSRWITLHALSVLRYFRGLELPPLTGDPRR